MTTKPSNSYQTWRAPLELTRVMECRAAKLDVRRILPVMPGASAVSVEGAVRQMARWVISTSSRPHPCTSSATADAPPQFARTMECVLIQQHGFLSWEGRGELVDAAAWRERLALCQPHLCAHAAAVATCCAWKPFPAYLSIRQGVRGAPGQHHEECPDLFMTKMRSEQDHQQQMHVRLPGSRVVDVHVSLQGKTGRFNAKCTMPGPLPINTPHGLGPAWLSMLT